MAITYVNSAKFPTSYPGGTNNIDTVTIAKPTSTAQNDVMVAYIVTVSGAVMTTVPSGWTLYDSVDNGSNLKLWIYRKVAGASEGSSYVWSDDSGAIGPMCGLISTWRGINTSNPLGEGNSATTTTTDPVTTPSVTTTQPSNLMLHFAVARTTTTQQAITTQGTFTNAAGQTERMNPANRGGTTEYSAELSNLTAMTHVGAGSQAGVTFDFTQIPANGIQYQLALVASIPTTSAPAEGVAASMTAYDASTALSTTSAFASAAVTAYDATVLTGIAATPTAAGATVTAFDAKGWIIFPAYAGVSAYDASVRISTDAETAVASVAAQGAVGYYGAPPSRSWRIPAETRAWRIPAEDRTWRIEAESRVWRIPSSE